MIRNALIWCPRKMLLKIFLISFFLQYSLGFDNFEGENPAGDPSFFHFLEDGWTILKKMPRGYMLPTPRVGRRQINEAKRQNMIPQPRIGRDVDMSNNQFSEILKEIQKFLLNGGFPLPTQHTLESKVSDKRYPENYDGTISKYANIILEEKGDRHADVNKYQSPRKELGDISHPTYDEKLEQKSNDDRVINISYFPKKADDLFSRETKDSGVDIYDGDERRALIPISRIRMDRLLDTVEDKIPAGGLIAYPRLGRQIWELHRTLTPYPRAGSLVVDPSSLEYDIFLRADGSDGIEDSLSDAFLNNKPFVQKRSSVKLIPRIGRKKRSIADEGDKKDNKENENGIPESDHSKIIWGDVDDLDNDYYFPTKKKNSRSKNAFVPRIGKKWSDYLNEYGEKRAVAFTPRIGRAALIPRIGRSNPLFRLKSRGSFVPRIGRRAALIPRIGRSANPRTVKDGAE